MYIGPGDNFRVRILNSNGVGEWVKSGKATLEKTPKNEIWGKWKMNSESFTIIIKGFEYEKKTEDARRALTVDGHFVGKDQWINDRGDPIGDLMFGDESWARPAKDPKICDTPYWWYP